MKRKGKLWERKRREILERDNYVCQRCGGWGNEVDHVVAVSEGGKMFDDGNLQVLCRICHIVKTYGEQKNRLKAREEWINRVRSWR